MKTKHNPVCLGTFPLSGVFSKIKRVDAENIIRKFIEEGGYYIDTAPLYGFGEVELLLGNVLKDFDRENYYIATKCGYVDVEGKREFNDVPKSAKYKDVIRTCEESLKRLKIEYIDLYIVHQPDPNTPFEETVEALLKLRDMGKIREIGVSNFLLSEVERFNKTGVVQYLQNRYSIINQSVDNKFARYIEEKGIHFMPYEVIERGQLTGKIFNNLMDFESTDRRRNLPDWREDRVEIITSWVKAHLHPIAIDLNITIGQLAIAYTLKKFKDSVPVVGLTNEEYININLKAGTITLPEEVFDLIDKKYNLFKYDIKAKYKVSIREFRGLGERYY